MLFYFDDVTEKLRIKIANSVKRKFCVFLCFYLILDKKETPNETKLATYGEK